VAGIPLPVQLKTPKLDYWIDGSMDRWNIGVLDYWIDGKLTDDVSNYPSIHLSINPFC